MNLSNVWQTWVKISKHLEKSLSSASMIKKNYGKFASVVIAKLEQIKQAADIRDLWKISGHWHELKGQAKDVYAVTLKHPFRLVLKMEPAYQTVNVIAIEDYHGKSNRISNYNFA